MKKIVMICLAAAVSFTARGQYAVGDAYESDGIKGVVISVDEGGNHGLFMVFKGLERVSAMPTGVDAEIAERMMAVGNIDNVKDMRAAAKQIRKENPVSKQTMKDAKAQQKEKVDSMRTKIMALQPHMKAVYGQITAEGSNNQKVVEAYCSDNGLDINELFPDYAWAKSLGEGWYVAGDRELEMYSYVIACGVGIDLYKGKGPKEVLNMSLAANAHLHETPGFELINLPTAVWSSTMEKNPKNMNVDYHFHCLASTMDSKMMKVVFRYELLTTYLESASVAAVHEF